MGGCPPPRLWTSLILCAATYSGSEPNLVETVDPGFHSPATLCRAGRSGRGRGGTPVRQARAPPAARRSTRRTRRTMPPRRQAQTRPILRAKPPPRATRFLYPHIRPALFPDEQVRTDAQPEPALSSNDDPPAPRQADPRQQQQPGAARAEGVEGYLVKFIPREQESKSRAPASGASTLSRSTPRVVGRRRFHPPQPAEGRGDSGRRPDERVEPGPRVCPRPPVHQLGGRLPALPAAPRCTDVAPFVTRMLRACPRGPAQYLLTSCPSCHADASRLPARRRTSARALRSRRESTGEGRRRSRSPPRRRVPAAERNGPRRRLRVRQPAY
eukprot:gene10776-biopygen5975